MTEDPDLGSTIAAVIKQGLDQASDPDPLAQCYEAEGFQLPMTIIVLDQDNEALRVVLSATGEMTTTKH